MNPVTKQKKVHRILIYLRDKGLLYDEMFTFCMYDNADILLFQPGVPAGICHKGHQ